MVGLPRSAALVLVSTLAGAGFLVASPSPLPAQVAAAEAAAAPAADRARSVPTGCVASPVEAQNPGFEAPSLGSGVIARQVAAAVVPGWKTTSSATPPTIELWTSGVASVPAYEGRQLAEVSAQGQDALFQDVPTQPGQRLVVRFAHRGRLGTDTLRVSAGAPGGALTKISDFSDPMGTWTVHRGEYTVPEGQYATRFEFQALVNAGGNPTFGNLIDDVTIGNGACVDAVKAVEHPGGGPIQVGDLLRYLIDLHNVGGQPAVGTTVTDLIPDGTDYVPGSLQVLIGRNAGRRTDTGGDADDASFNAAARQTRFTVGAPAGTGTELAPDAHAVVAFEVRINDTAAGQDIGNAGTVSYTDTITGDTITGNTNQVDIPVAAATDLAVALQAPDIVPAGTEFTLTATATNHGSLPDPDVAVTLTLDPGQDIVTLPAGCTTAAPRQVTCAVGPLAAGVSIDLPLRLRLVGVPDADSYATSAQVSGGVHDLDLSDNRATTVVVAGQPPPVVDVAVGIAVARPVVAGLPARATVAVTNVGELTTAAILTLPVPDGLQNPEVVFPDAVGAACTPVAGPAIRCQLGPLGSGESAVGQLVGDLDSSAADGSSLTVSASVTAAGDVAPSNDSATDAAPVGSVADAAVAVHLLDRHVGGTRAILTALALNLGPSSTTIDTTIQLPPGATFVSSSTGCSAAGSDTVTCPAAVFAPRSDRLFVITVRLPMTTEPTSVPFAASVSVTGSADPVTSNNTDQVTVGLEPPVDLAVTKRFGPASVAVGEESTITVRVRNNGPGTARQTLAHDLLPGGLTVRHIQVTRGEYRPGTGAWTIGRMAPGGQATLTAVIVATRPGTILNNAVVVNDFRDTLIDDNVAFARLAAHRTAAPTEPGTPDGPDSGNPTAPGGLPDTGAGPGLVPLALAALAMTGFGAAMLLVSLKTRS